MPTANLYEAKTRLSALVERAAAGEEIVIAKNGVARARLVPVAATTAPRRPANALRVSRIAEDFDAPDAAIAWLFAGDERFRGASHSAGSMPGRPANWHGRMPILSIACWWPRGAGLPPCWLPPMRRYGVIAACR